MFYEKLQIFLALLAGLIALVLGIILNMEFADIILRVLIVILVFLILGSIVKSILNKRVFVSKDEEDILSDNDISGDTNPNHENMPNEVLPEDVIQSDENSPL